MQISKRTIGIKSTTKTTKNFKHPTNLIIVKFREIKVGKLNQVYLARFAVSCVSCYHCFTYLKIYSKFSYRLFPSYTLIVSDYQQCIASRCAKVNTIEQQNV